MSNVIFHTKALRGRLGVYLAYYVAGYCHVRFMGDPNPELEVWGDIPATELSWLPITCLLVGAWEASVDPSFLAVFPDRVGAWIIATAGAEKRDRAYVYNEWNSDSMWHVGTFCPKGKA